jgi:pyridoxine 5-phosphate synthase
MTKLSVNINKVATLRNARGHNNPDVVKVAIDCQRFGAQGITIHPRPDQRHITTKDVYELKSVITTEYNIEGYPDQRYLDLVSDTRPEQATLVPDAPDAITSNQGWDTIKHFDFLKDVTAQIHSIGTRVSIFVETNPRHIEAAKKLGADRVELYTEPYASLYHINRESAIAPYIEASMVAKSVGLVINAGHDLDLHNLNYLVTRIPYIEEVSIGHALICDALYFGLENTIQMYLQKLSV